MYAHINGILSEKTPDGVVIECYGVGYMLLCSKATLASAPQVGEKFKCYTYLSVREDAMELYGFVSKEERSFFEKLRTVSGIGSKSALSILSTLTVRDLSVAIVTSDINSIARSPGVGKKTAQRIVLELKDKVENQDFMSDLSGASAPITSGASGEAIEALMALGYSSSDAAKAIALVPPSASKVDEIITFALRGMDRK